MNDANEDAPRYAVYFVPAAESALYRLGASVLGYDCYRGAEIPFHATCAAWTRPWADVIREPRRYGFHATLKAPFRLASTDAEPDLIAAMEAFADARRMIPAIALDVGALGAFVAMTPRTDCEPLQHLAADCVAALDRFRAPLSDGERARRRPERLSPAQRSYLDRWGYPYVFGEFRFHMTLTGPLEAAERDAAAAMLRQIFAQQCGEARIAVDRLSLVRQDTPRSAFVLLQQWPLEEAASDR